MEMMSLNDAMSLLYVVDGLREWADTGSRCVAFAQGYRQARDSKGMSSARFEPSLPITGDTSGEGFRRFSSGAGYPPLRLLRRVPCGGW